MHLYYPVHGPVTLYATKSLNILIRVERIKTRTVTFVFSWSRLARTSNHLFLEDMRELSSSVGKKRDIIFWYS